MKGRVLTAMLDKIVTLLTTIDDKVGRLLEAINTSVGIDDDHPRPTDSKTTGRTLTRRVDVPDPSSPLSVKEAAGFWGGSMNQRKLARLMKTGRVRYAEINRQLFTFSRNDIPNLPPEKELKPTGTTCHHDR